MHKEKAKAKTKTKRLQTTRTKTTRLLAFCDGYHGRVDDETQREMNTLRSREQH